MVYWANTPQMIRSMFKWKIRVYILATISGEISGKKRTIVEELNKYYVCMYIMIQYLSYFSNIYRSLIVAQLKRKILNVFILLRIGECKLPIWVLSNFQKGTIHFNFWKRANGPSRYLSILTKIHLRPQNLLASIVMVSFQSPPNSKKLFRS